MDGKDKVERHHHTERGLMTLMNGVKLAHQGWDTLHVSDIKHDNLRNKNPAGVEPKVMTMIMMMMMMMHDVDWHGHRKTKH